MSAPTAGNPDNRPHLQVADPVRLKAAAEEDAWSRFSAATSVEAFCHGWLAVTCTRTGAVDGILVLASPDGRGFVPAAAWPETKRDRAKLAEAIEHALEKRALVAVTVGEKDARLHVAQPIELEGELLGAVAVDVEPRAERELKSLARDLSWGAGWLEALLRRSLNARESETSVRLRKVFDLFSASLEHHGFVPAATATVTELATLLDCDRVALAVTDGKRLRVKALSHTVNFEKNAELTRAIEAAMEEAVDQKTTLVWPGAPEGDGHVRKEHDQLAQSQGSAGVLTVPLNRLGDPVGALCLERDRPFDADSVELVDGLAALLGPLVSVQRAAERGPFGRMWDSAKDLWSRFFGPGHLVWKLAGVITALVVLFFTFMTATYRVAANTKIEGAVQRALAAPFEGYVREAFVRPGDVVKQGAMVARLDDRDLQLERLKNVSRREQLVKQYREALANHDRAQIRVIGSQIDQAEAELQVVQEKLARTEIKAPFDGVIVSGDLSQQLGAPVQRGQVLFEVAPLEDYRVVLKVDERDVRDLTVGQKGELVLSSMPSQKLPIHVARITPVSTAEDGKNYFRVEAKLEQGVERLRPGMEGVGKVQVGERKLIWIWTRYLVDWLRIQLWWLLP
ncbi:MAG: efflux RND transporter periplasmic adaptor subunit [Betaproteobacteria bacterium]|nr:efflux RND transporter periplasmic adaptor subunit [Betaproteobacteria bacterium]